MAKKKEAATPEQRLQEALVPCTEWSYKVPENWCWVKLGSLIQEIKNGTTVKQDKSGIGYPVTRIESLQNQTIDFRRLGYIVDSATIKDTDWYQNNDIALSHINSAEHVGKTALITKDMLPLVHGMNLLRLRFNDAIMPQLFQYFSRSFPYKDAILQRINMAVNQVSINQKQISSLEFPLPPLPEQQRIVERIESLFAQLDEAKEKAQAALDSFEPRKAAILHKAFTGELTAKWREEHGVGMESWKHSCLGQYLLPMRTKKPEGDCFRYIDIDAIDNKTQTVKSPKILPVEKAPSRAARGLSPNAILFSMVRPYLKNIAFIDDGLSDCIASTGFYVCICKQSLIPLYLYHFLCSNDAIDYLMQFMKGDNSPSIKKDDLVGMNVSIPTTDEQIEIVRILDSFLAKEQKAKEATEAVLEQIDLTKKSILSRAFRGDLGTNDPNEESATELLKEILKKEV